jgi:DNA-binding PucR family transcriptional regulator
MERVSPSDLDQTPVPILPKWSRELVEMLDTEAIAERIVDEGLRSAFPAHLDDTEFIDTFRAGVRENTATLQRYLTGQIRLDDIVPARPLKLAALQARLDIPESTIQHSYRIGTQVMISEWTRDIAARAEAGDITTAQALSAVESFTLAMMAFQNRVLRSVSAAHETELATLRASRVQMRRQIMREILRGEDLASSSDLSSTLGYDLSLNHVAVILPRCPEHRSRQLIQKAHAAVKASASTTLPLSGTATAVWLGRSTEWSERTLRDLSVALADQEILASLGDPAPGLQGFRETFSEARRAEGVRGAWGADAPAVMQFGDVQLESIALSDITAARRFVAHELGELVVDDPAAERLRQTLQVWFETGSHVSTAAKLKLHEHSVRNRLRRAEEAIGYPLTTRRTDLQVALRLYRVVQPIDGQEGSSASGEPRASSG